MIDVNEIVYEDQPKRFEDSVTLRKGACFKDDVQFQGGLFIHDAFYAPLCSRKPTEVWVKAGGVMVQAKDFITVQLATVLCTVYDTGKLHVDCNMLPHTMPYHQALPRLKAMNKEWSELVRFSKNLMLLRRKK